MTVSQVARKDLEEWIGWPHGPLPSSPLLREGNRKPEGREAHQGSTWQPFPAGQGQAGESGSGGAKSEPIPTESPWVLTSESPPSHTTALLVQMEKRRKRQDIVFDGITGCAGTLHVHPFPLISEHAGVTASSHLLCAPSPSTGKRPYCLQCLGVTSRKTLPLWHRVSK